MLEDLNNKNLNIESTAQKALKDENVQSELLENLKSKNETIRYNSAKTLWLISEKHPEVLYPQWDYLVELLSSENTYHKCSAISIVASLTNADTKNKFEKIFDKYFSLLDDKSMITAFYIAANSGKIANAKPKLQAKITNKLLSIEETHHEQQRRNLIKSAAIESFDEYFEEAENKEKIIEFVKKQLECKSPKTKKIAKEFLKKWGNYSKIL